MVRISELAELAGVTPRAIRHYHRIGLLPEPVRRSNGYRDYVLADAVRLLRVRRLIGTGMSLDEVAEAMADEGGQDAREILRELDAELAEQQRRIAVRRERLAALLAADADPRLAPGTAELFAELSAALGSDHPGLAREQLVLEAIGYGAGEHEDAVFATYRQALADPEHVRRLMAANDRFEELADCEPGDPRVAELGREMARMSAALALQTPEGATAGELSRWLDLVIADLAPPQAECLRICFAALRESS